MQEHDISAHAVSHPAARMASPHRWRYRMLAESGVLLHARYADSPCYLRATDKVGNGGPHPNPPRKRGEGIPAAP